MFHSSIHNATVCTVLGEEGGCGDRLFVFFIPRHRNSSMSEVTCQSLLLPLFTLSEQIDCKSKVIISHFFYLGFPAVPDSLAPILLLLNCISRSFTPVLHIYIGLGLKPRTMFHTCMASGPKQFKIQARLYWILNQLTEKGTLDL